MIFRPMWTTRPDKPDDSLSAVETIAVEGYLPRLGGLSIVRVLQCGTGLAGFV